MLTLWKNSFNPFDQNDFFSSRSSQCYGCHRSPCSPLKRVFQVNRQTRTELEENVAAYSLRPSLYMIKKQRDPSIRLHLVLHVSWFAQECPLLLWHSGHLKRSQLVLHGLSFQNAVAVSALWSGHTCAAGCRCLYVHPGFLCGGGNTLISSQNHQILYHH